MAFQPRVTQGFHTNYAPALANFGAQIGAGIQQYQRKQEEKKREDMAVEYILSQGLATDEKEARAGYKALGPQGFMAFMGEKADQEYRDKMLEIRGKESEARLNESEARISSLEQPTTFSKEDIGKAQPVQGAPGYAFVPLSEKHGQLIITGNQGTEVEPMELGETKTINGVTWVWDGNSIKANPGSSEEDVLKSLIDIGKIMSGDLGDYYRDTRDSEGKLKKGIFGVGGAKKNPLYERQLQALESAVGEGESLMGYIPNNAPQAELINDAPDGVDPAVWEVMTPEQKALWQN